MKEMTPLRPVDWSALASVFLLALAGRCGYVLVCTDQAEGQPQWRVQGDSPTGETQTVTELEEVIANVRDSQGFRARALFSSGVENTASLSPGYPWLRGMLARGNWSADAVVRWLQCGLGALTAAFYFLFARRAFRSTAIGFLAGLLAAVHPYWIINTAELQDGVLATFLLAANLALGTRVAEEGGPFTSLLFGVLLAFLALVRAALLPLALLALLLFLLRCQKLPHGWLCAVLAFLGFGNGLAPWFVRNLQAYEEPLPIVSSTWLHLWMGNNPRATGGALPEEEVTRVLGPQRTAQLRAEPNQARRYRMLAWDTVEEIRQYPGDAVQHRLSAGAAFVLGEAWLRKRDLAEKRNATLDTTVVAAPEWLGEALPGLLAGSLLFLFVFGLLGWRRSATMGGGHWLAALALIWAPLPYLLSHAEYLVGPRLPVDGVWLTFAAVGLSTLWKRAQRAWKTRPGDGSSMLAR